MATLAIVELAACTAVPTRVQCSDVSGTIDLSFESSRRAQLDLLLVIDNSSTMARKQAALAEKFSQLLTALENHSVGVDLHIGVVTTDVGSWAFPGQPFSTSAGACDSFAGDGGKLQAVSCLDRTNVSTEAMQACNALCPDRRFVPQDGSSFLIRHREIYNVPSALELDVKTGLIRDRGPEYALKCMALVGDGGCAQSSPLEAMKRALDGRWPENAPFLRNNSLLAVLILTDKDDCSVQLSRRAENDPRTRDCTVPDPDAPADCFDPAFRCLARNIKCNEPFNTTGNKTGCHERSDSYLQPVDAYVRFLKALRPDTQRLAFGVWTVPALDERDQLIVEQNPSVAGSAGLRAGTGAQASCQLSSDSTFYGQPELRLNQFSQMLGQSFPSIDSVCEPTQYGERAIATLSEDLLICYRKLLCSREPKRIDGKPVCLAGDVPLALAGTLPDLPMPECSASCCTAMVTYGQGCGGVWGSGVVAACQPEAADCFCAARAWQQDCDGALYGVWRKDNADAPSGTITTIRCALPEQLICPSAS